MSRFAIRNPYFIVVVCLIIAVVGVTQPRPHAGGHVPRHEHPGGGGGDVLQRHAAGADRDRHHQPLRALLHPGQRHRAHRVALAAGRQRDQGLLPAGHECRFGRDHDLEPGDGAICAGCRRARCRRSC